MSDVHDHNTRQSGADLTLPKPKTNNKKKAFSYGDEDHHFPFFYLRTLRTYRVGHVPLCTYRRRHAHYYSVENGEEKRDVIVWKTNYFLPYVGGGLPIL